jgi:hypothetical protein
MIEHFIVSISWIIKLVISLICNFMREDTSILHSFSVRLHLHVLCFIHVLCPTYNLVKSRLSLREHLRLRSVLHGV